MSLPQSRLLLFSYYYHYYLFNCELGILETKSLFVVMGNRDNEQNLSTFNIESQVSYRRLKHT
jgi:hypothetical protein